MPTVMCYHNVKLYRISKFYIYMGMFLILLRWLYSTIEGFKNVGTVF